jgi:hypothetical protein
MFPYNEPKPVPRIREKDLVLVKPTVRQLLQEIGTEAMRNVIHPNIWINALFANYNPKVTYSMEIIDLGASNLQREKIGKPVHDEYPNWIITDLRFGDELEAVKQRGGITIRVNRPDLIENSKTDKTFPVKVHRHISETALDNHKFDYVINNDSDIKSLIEKVKQILIKENIINEKPN